MKVCSCSFAVCIFDSFRVQLSLCFPRIAHVVMYVPMADFPVKLPISDLALTVVLFLSCDWLLLMSKTATNQKVCNMHRLNT